MGELMAQFAAKNTTLEPLREVPCIHETHTCSDGKTLVARDPTNKRAFRVSDCPAVEGEAEENQCPSPKVCPNGETVIADPAKDCAFPKCSPEGYALLTKIAAGVLVVPAVVGVVYYYVYPWLSNFFCPKQDSTIVIPAEVEEVPAKKESKPTPAKATASPT